MKKINKFIILVSILFSASVIFININMVSSFNSNSLINTNKLNLSHSQNYDSISSDDCSECTSNPSGDCSECTSIPSGDWSECTSNSSNGGLNCTHGCFTIVPVSADYISFKKSSNPLFNDLFNFANELGFTQCIAKYLVYKKNTSEFIGFMGLRVNESFNDKIALFSFENSSLDTVLVQFSISSENITTFSVFDRSSGIEISDRTVISSYGAFESLENIDWETILLIDDLVGFLNYRFDTVKQEFEGMEITNSISLNEDEFIASLRDPDIYAYALELGYNSFVMANRTIFQNEEDVIVGILQDVNEQKLALLDTINKSCLMNYTCENTNCTMTLFTRDKGAILDITNLLIIEEWGSEFHSCSPDRCFWPCLLDWLGSPGGVICVGVCGLICSGSRAACVACLSVCAAWALVACTVECNEDPCSHGHVCRPGTRRYIGCSGTARIYQLCRSDGTGWQTTTHYDYCPSHYYCRATAYSYQCVPYPYPQVAAHLTTGLPLYDFMTVCFSSDGSIDYDGYITEYYWTFGDGSYSYARYPCHQFCSGYYNVRLRVTDNDGNHRSTTLQIRVYDDDNSPPVITIDPFGDATDSSPGYWDVQVSDPQSGLAEIVISVDGIYRGSSSGHYSIPISLGPHVISVYAKNNDNDKEGCDDDQEYDTKTNTVIIRDDDITAPELMVRHTGNLFDGDPGFLEFSITEVDPGSHATGTLTIQGPYNFFWTQNYGECVETLNLKNIGICELGEYNVTLYAENNDEDRGEVDEESDSTSVLFSLIDDDTGPPIITISLGEDYDWDETGTLVNFTFTVDAYDDSGFSSIYINMGDYTANFLGYHEALLPEGIYDLTVTIWDNDDDRFYELDMLSSTETIKGIILDLTPPETVILIEPCYVDSLGNFYVTHLTNFWFDATDNVAGVDYTEYRIVDLTEWLPAGLFTLEGCPDGIYTIEFYSVDNVGNREDTKSIDVILVSLDVESYITRGQSEIINNFEVIFRKCKQDGVEGYKLVATNPGQIFYNIEITNDWPITIDTLLIEPTLPTDFVMKGANPIHVFLDGTEITNLCEIEGSIITVYNLAPDSIVKVIIHVDYGLKGEFYPTLDEFWIKSYIFYTEIHGNGGLPSQIGGSLIGTYSSSFDFIAYEKKAAAIIGFVKDANGIPLANVIVELKLPDGKILTTETNSEGLYYFIDLKADQHEIRFIRNGIPSAWLILHTMKDAVLWMDMIF